MPVDVGNRRHSTIWVRVSTPVGVWGSVMDVEVSDSVIVVWHQPTLTSPHTDTTTSYRHHFTPTSHSHHLTPTLPFLTHTTSHRHHHHLIPTPPHIHTTSWGQSHPHVPCFFKEIRSTFVTGSYVVEPFLDEWTWTIFLMQTVSCPKRKIWDLYVCEVCFVWVWCVYTTQHNTIRP